MKRAILIVAIALFGSGCASTVENRISTEEFNPETGQVYRDEIVQRAKAGPMSEVEPLQDTQWDFETGIRMQQSGTLDNTKQAEVYDVLGNVIGAAIRALIQSGIPLPGSGAGDPGSGEGEE